MKESGVAFLIIAVLLLASVLSGPNAYMYGWRAVIALGIATLIALLIGVILIRKT